MQDTRALLRISLTASAAIERGQLLSINNKGQAAVVGAATDAAVGIAQHSAAQGAQVDLVVAGIARGKASARIAAGDRVTGAADGQLAKSAKADNLIIGIALEKAVAQNDEIDVLISPSQQ